jgi:hypothetical protein
LLNIKKIYKGRNANVVRAKTARVKNNQNDLNEIITIKDHAS